MRAEAVRACHSVPVLLSTGLFATAGAAILLGATMLIGGGWQAIRTGLKVWNVAETGDAGSGVFLVAAVRK